MIPEQEILKGISRELRKRGITSYVNDSMLQINLHCSFKIDGACLVKLCSREHRVNLANPEYIDNIIAIMDKCKTNWITTNCLNSICEIDRPSKV